jgi:protein-S-isoprenylcysteine O-methyltransferase Ste14
MLRLVLVSGLIFHKLIWEVMKKKDNPGIPHPPFRVSFKSLVKLLKVIVLAFLVLQTLFLDLFPISGHPALLRVIGTGLFFMGVAMAVAARLQLGKNWVNIEDYQVLPKQSLITGGIYRYVRHPIYTGDIFLLVGLELALNSWLVLAVLFPLFVVIRQALKEEALLYRVFPEYAAYCIGTKRFIPFLL